METAGVTDDALPRVVVMRVTAGLAGMQVCAVDDATDAEILEVCNRENPSGVGPWSGVVRQVDDARGINERHLPVPCAARRHRTHFMVWC